MSDTSEIKNPRRPTSSRGNRKTHPDEPPTEKLNNRPVSAKETRNGKQFHNPSTFGDNDLQTQTGSVNVNNDNKAQCSSCKKKRIRSDLTDPIKASGSKSSSGRKSGTSTPIKPSSPKNFAFATAAVKLSDFNNGSPPIQNLLKELTAAKPKSYLQQQQPKSVEDVLAGAKYHKPVVGNKPRPKSVGTEIINESQSQSKAKSKPKDENSKSRIKKPVVKTQVVLAPRFGPESSEPSKLVIPEDESPEGYATEANETSQKNTGRVRTRPSNGFVLNPSNNFPPEKARWVHMALEKLGKSWVDSGVVPPYIMDFSGFQKKIGDLYDMALNKKYNQVNQSVSQALIQETEKKKGVSRKKNASSGKVVQAGNNKSSSVVEDDPSEQLQKRVSDVLLQMLLQRMMPDANGEVNGTKDVSTSTRHSTSRSSKNGYREGSPMSLGDGPKTHKADHDSFKINNSFVFEGKICPVESNQKPVSTFAPLSESRRKNEPDTSLYFRKRADVRGFEAEEISIKYSNKSVFVEAKQMQEKNHRLVREIISLPPHIKIGDLKVMRAKNNGRLIFEEILKSESSVASTA